MERKILILMAILILLGVKNSWAEEKENKNSIRLEKIVVTPLRIEENYGDVSRGIDMVTSKDIELSHASDVGKVLEGLSSVNIKEYGSLGALQNISIRGASSDQVLILMDGRPLNSPRSGQVDLSDIPLQDVERIEILRGPASNLYGSGAVGGVVNIITKEPEQKPLIQIKSGYGTFNTYHEQLIHSQKLDKFSYLLTTDYKSSDGHRDNSDYQAYNFSTKLEFDYNPNERIVLNVGYHESDLGTPYKITSPDLDDRQRKNKNFIDLSWNTENIDGWNIKSRIFQDYERLKFIENPTDWDTHTTKMRGFDLRVSKPLFESFTLLSGLNFQKNLNNSSTTGKHEYILRSLYLQNMLDFKDIDISFGARLDDYSNFGTELSPSLNIGYRIDDIKLYAILARSFRVPTFNDLYWPSTGWAEGNPNLSPEEGVCGEVGFKLFNQNYILDTTYFRNDLNDLIDWAEGDDGIWRPYNVDQALTQGVELNITSSITDNLKGSLNYTYLRAKNDKTDKYLTYRPIHKIGGSLEYTGPGETLIKLTGNYQSKSFTNTSNTDYIDEFFVMGMDIQKNINDNIDWYISINNLWDRKYQEKQGYPMPGFQVFSGVKMKF